MLTKKGNDRDFESSDTLFFTDLFFTDTVFFFFIFFFYLKVKIGVNISRSIIQVVADYLKFS